MTDRTDEPDPVSRLDETIEEADGELAERLRDVRSDVETLREEKERLAAENRGLLEELRETNRGTLELTAELEERYRKLFETAVEGIYTTPPDADRYLLANPSMADVLGYDSGDELCQAVESIEADVFVDPDRYEEYYERLRSAGQLDDFEYRVRRADGEVRWVSDSATELTEDGELEGFRGGVIDITERKERESRIREHRDMLSVLNQILRHDIRNDMNVIRGWTQILEDHVDEDMSHTLQRVLDASEHVVVLTTVARDLVETVTDEEESLGGVDVSTVVESELEAKRTAHPEATFRVDGDVPAVSVRGNEMLSSVFGNVLYNAVQHNDKDRPKVTVSAETRDESVVVRVADNGPGIPDSEREAVFGRGEKGLDSAGSGLGLYLVDTLVRRYGGDVWVEDNDPEGAIVAVELPKADDDSNAP